MRVGRLLIVLALLTAATAGLEERARSVHAQGQPAAAASATPRMPDGKPNFSGFWDPPKRPGPNGTFARVFDPERMAPFQPGAEPLFNVKRTGNPQIDEPRAFCWPSGFPWGIFAPYAMQMVQTNEYLVMVHEMGTTRMIPLDGRPHRTDIEPTFYGDPVGRWEGDTLVIDTRNFKRWILDDSFNFQPVFVRWHSDALHTIERMRWTGPTRVSWEITVDDPKIFTRPWTQEFFLEFRPDWNKGGLIEFVCQENNRCEGGKCKPFEDAK